MKVNFTYYQGRYDYTDTFDETLIEIVEAIGRAKKQRKKRRDADEEVGTESTI